MELTSPEIGRITSENDLVGKLVSYRLDSSATEGVLEGYGQPLSAQDMGTFQGRRLQLVTSSGKILAIRFVSADGSFRVEAGASG